jgi:short subunit dehydrogenase-like uncharacterized protein
MRDTILLYGATGFSGRLIGAQAEALGMGRNGRSDVQLVLGGRDGRGLAELAEARGMDHRVFSLRDERVVRHALREVDVVLNAAGPFALTGDRLAKSALGAGCHYVDINGEASVYMRLDNLALHAYTRERALVSSAGFTAAGSDMLLAAALQHLRDTAGFGTVVLGAVRIALPLVPTLSRGSVETILRSLREQVTVVRLDQTRRDPAQPANQVISHEPIGRLERTFDFGNYDGRAGRDEDDKAAADRRDPRIASAANLADTLTARRTVVRQDFRARRIESYLETGRLARLAFQAGAFLAPLAAIPSVRALADLPLQALPDGPPPQDRERERGVVLLEIEDRFQERVVDWAWTTPSPYDVTAQLSLEIARRVARTNPRGWLTPSELLAPTRAELEHPGVLDPSLRYLAGCRLHDRSAVRAGRS